MNELDYDEALAALQAKGTYVFDAGSNGVPPDGGRFRALVASPAGIAPNLGVEGLTIDASETVNFTGFCNVMAPIQTATKL
jgi:hypothetical protein